MAIFKQSTSYTHQFSVVLSSDHTTAATGKAVTVKIGKNGAAGVTSGSTTVEVDSTNLAGIYSLSLTPTDVNTLGSFVLYATATGCDPTREVHQVQATIFPDLQLNANGRALIANNLQQNAALNPFVFPMVNANGQRTTGLSVTAQRTLGAGGFSACANAVSEIGTTGIYSINLNSSDLNATTIGLLFTATGANDLFVPLTPTP